jgi:hypothetical protein
MTVRLMPSPELVVGNYLRASSDVQAVVGQRVSGKRSSTPTYPLVIMTLVTGREIVRTHFDGVQFQFSAYGKAEAGGEIAAELAIRTVRAVLLEMTGVHDGAVVTEVRTLSTIRPAPDDSVPEPFPGYMFDAEVLMHPVPA